MHPSEEDLSRDHQVRTSSHQPVLSRRQALGLLSTVVVAETLAVLGLRSNDNPEANRGKETAACSFNALPDGPVTLGTRICIPLSDERGGDSASPVICYSPDGQFFECNGRRFQSIAQTRKRVLFKEITVNLGTTTTAVQMKNGVLHTTAHPGMFTSLERTTEWDLSRLQALCRDLLETQTHSFVLDDETTIVFQMVEESGASETGEGSEERVVPKPKGDTIASGN